MTMTCVICRHYLTERPAVCCVCRPRLAHDLGELVSAWRTLSAEPGRSRAERITGTPDRPLGVKIAALDLMLPARHVAAIRDLHGDQSGVTPVAVMLDSWVRDWAELRGERLPLPTVPELADWLHRRADWACDEHPAIDEYAREIRATLAACRAAVGDIRGDDTITIGACPTALPAGEECRYRLRADPYIDNITCRRCQTVWPKRHWLWIHDRQTGAELDQQARAC